MQELDHPEALLALRDDVVRAVLAGEVADDIGDRADPVEVDLAGLVDARVALGEDADLPFGADGILGGGDRARPAEGDRDHHAREEHEAAAPARWRSRRRGSPAPVRVPFSASLALRVSMSATSGSLDLVQAYQQATVGVLALDGVVAAGRQRDPPLEAAIGQLHAVDAGAAERFRQAPRAADHQLVAVGSRPRRCSRSTPGSATKIRSSAAVSMMSTGGSQLGLLCPWRSSKKRPRISSASFSMARICAHIQTSGFRAAITCRPWVRLFAQGPMMSRFCPAVFQPLWAAASQPLPAHACCLRPRSKRRSGLNGLRQGRAPFPRDDAGSCDAVDRATSSIG